MSHGSDVLAPPSSETASRLRRSGPRHLPLGLLRQPSGLMGGRFFLFSLASDLSRFELCWFNFLESVLAYLGRQWPHRSALLL